MITCIVPFSGNAVGLSQLLVSLQPQLHPDDDIYIIDSTKDRSGVRIAKLYGSTRCFIFVEVSPKEEAAAVQLGLQSMKENKQEGALVIYPNLVIPTTFIANLKKAMREMHDILIFNEAKSDDFLDPNFKWFTPPPTITDSKKTISEIEIASAFITSRIIDDKTFQPRLNNELGIGFIESEHIVLLPDY